MTDVLLIVPTPAGVRFNLNGLDIYKPLTAIQLLDFSRRFADAAAERLQSEGVGSWEGKEIQL